MNHSKLFKDICYNFNDVLTQRERNLFPLYLMLLYGNEAG